MKNVNTTLILAGGKGTRFSEYTKTIPKPMINANGKPLLIHILNIYASQGVENFVILAGYKIEVIFNYFVKNAFEKVEENFFSKNNIKIRILDTGLETQTGGRIRQGLKYVEEDYFYLTYGDGISNINLKELNSFHFNNETVATLTAVRPPARFGSLELRKDNFVKAFGEKNNAKEGWINGGFFLLNKSVSEYLKDDSTPFEKMPLEVLAKTNQLKAYLHSGYWRPVDTIRELEILEQEMLNGFFKFYE